MMATFISTNSGFLNLDFISRFRCVNAGPDYFIRFYATERNPAHFDGNIGQLRFHTEELRDRAYGLFIEEITTQRPGTGLGNRLVDVFSLLESPPEETPNQ